MSDIAIRSEHISKQYSIGTLRKQQTILDAFHGKFFRPRIGIDSILWALKDVSFKIKTGDVVGILGRNGAGKSTLLKILSQVTEPTSGWAEINGRVGSLLEVGTGFHQDLTGRENIYLNGAILGMSRSEVRRNFDQIVAFAEIERFLDTPVKHYSSGMYVRLAFAIAAHLESDVLLIDEVLAVGDASFQKKCLGRVDHYAHQGRTVLFVSHNMATILSVCKSAIWLDSGQIRQSGPCEEVAEAYVLSLSSDSRIPLDVRQDRSGDGSVRLTSMTISNASDSSAIRCTDRLKIRLEYKSANTISKAVFLIGIYDQFNRTIFFLDSAAAGGLPDKLPATGVIECVTDPICITPGLCIVNIAVKRGEEMADHIGAASSFHVEADDFYGTGKLTNRQTTLFLLKQNWNLLGP